MFADGTHKHEKAGKRQKSDSSASDDIDAWQKLYKAKKVTNKKYKERQRGSTNPNGGTMQTKVQSSGSGGGVPDSNSYG